MRLSPIGGSLGHVHVEPRQHYGNRTTGGFSGLVSRGLSYRLLRSVFNALHVRTITVSLARGPG